MSENKRQVPYQARDNNGIVIGWVDQAEPDTLIAERSSEELEAEYADLVDRIEPINPAYASICECLASYSQDVIDRLESRPPTRRGSASTPTSCWLRGW